MFNCNVEWKIPRSEFNFLSWNIYIIYIYIWISKININIYILRITIKKSFFTGFHWMVVL